MTISGDETNRVEASSNVQKMGKKVKKMNQLKLKLKTAKGKVTKVLFEKYKHQRGSSKRLNVKAKDIQGQLTKLEKEY